MARYISFESALVINACTTLRQSFFIIGDVSVENINHSHVCGVHSKEAIAQHAMGVFVDANRWSSTRPAGSGRQP